jgi:hypothetical protein
MPAAAHAPTSAKPWAAAPLKREWHPQRATFLHTHAMRSTRGTDSVGKKQVYLGELTRDAARRIQNSRKNVVDY